MTFTASDLPSHLNEGIASRAFRFYGGYSPRVGFAYNSHNSNTTVSGAFGITHFPGNFGAMGGFLEENFPFFEVFENPAQLLNIPLTPLSVSGLPSYVPTPTSAPVAPPAGVGVEFMYKQMQPDVALAWNFGVQQRVTNSTSIGVNYVGTRGLHLFRRFDISGHSL